MNIWMHNKTPQKPTKAWKNGERDVLERKPSTAGLIRRDFSKTTSTAPAQSSTLSSSGFQNAGRPRWCGRWGPSPPCHPIKTSARLPRKLSITPTSTGRKCTGMVPITTRRRNLSRGANVRTTSRDPIWIPLERSFLRRTLSWASGIQSCGSNPLSIWCVHACKHSGMEPLRAVSNHYSNSCSHNTSLSPLFLHI